MASRFEIIDEEYMEEFNENENTKKSMEYWKKVFKKWANERNFQANLAEYESDVYNFSHCSVTLNIAGNEAVHKGTIDVRREYKHVSIEESDSE